MPAPGIGRRLAEHRAVAALPKPVVPRLLGRRQEVIEAVDGLTSVPPTETTFGLHDGKFTVASR